MNITLRLLLMSIYLVAFCTSSALATEAIMRNVSYDDCTVSGHLHSSFAEFFEESTNIFEGTVTAIGPIPNRPTTPANECWVSFHVKKWHNTSLTTNEVNAIMHTDVTQDAFGNINEVKCPVEKGKTYLLFGGEYKTESGTGNTSFYFNQCSLYTPIGESRFLIGLLNSWNSNKK